MPCARLGRARVKGFRRWLARFGRLAPLALAALVAFQPTLADANELSMVRQAFAQQVSRHLSFPAAVAVRYAGLLTSALQADGREADAGDWAVLIDRNPRVQAAMLFARPADDAPWQWVGAAPVSTGKPGTFDHFITPTGVFSHSMDNMDFRAEGTYNENGIRGYGVSGMRIYDFGWVDAQRGWGKGGRARCACRCMPPIRTGLNLGWATRPQGMRADSRRPESPP